MSIIDRTPAPNCSACAEKRRHEHFELVAHHPFAGHGYTRESGWSHAALGAGINQSIIIGPGGEWRKA